MADTENDKDPGDKSDRAAFKVHDKLVHGVFSSTENARALIRSGLKPDLARRIDFGSLKSEPTKHTGPHMEEGYSDLLYSAELDGRRVLIYVLVEHFSSNERFAVVRVLLYVLLTYWGIIRDENPEYLPPIVPILLHHSESGWTAATRFEEVIEPAALGIEPLLPLIPRFEILLDDISHASDEELLLRRQLPLLAALALWLLRDARNADRFFAHLAVWAGRLDELAKDQAQRAAIGLVMSYITEVLGRDRARQLRQRLVELAPAAERAMQSIAQSWEQKGMEKGMEKGRKELVHHLLTKKFGELPQATLHRLEAATAEQLLEYADRVLTAERLEDVFES